MVSTGSIGVIRRSRSTRQPTTFSLITLSIPLEIGKIAFPEALRSIGLINYSLWTRLLNPTSYHSGTEVNKIVFCQVFHSTPVNKLMIKATYIPLPSARSKWSVSLATGGRPQTFTARVRTASLDGGTNAFKGNVTVLKNDTSANLLPCTRVN